MIQLTRPKVGDSALLHLFRINLKDKFTSDFDTDNGILMYLKSQLTGKLITTTPIVNWGASTYNDRFTTIYLYVDATTSNWNIGYLQMGTIEYPLGFYDISIWQNSSPTNFNSFGLNKVYTGLANVITVDDAASPTYKEYTTNDYKTENVYLTLG